MNPNITQYTKQGGLTPSYRYVSSKGEISRINHPLISNGLEEIYCIKGDLFEDVRRYETLEQAEKRIEELLA